MPILNTRVPAYKKRADLEVEWKDFRGGLNLLLRPTELKQNEMAQADNVLLKGSGVPTGRWGTARYFTVNATGTIRGFGTYKNTMTGTNELLALSDQGYLVKKNGTGSTSITGQSWPSGTQIRAEQLGGNTYIVSSTKPLTKYAGATLVPFTPIDAPTNLSATNYSGASGAYTWSWKITTLSDTGETTATNITLGSLPQDLTRTRVDIRWSAPSVSSSSLIKGYSIYRGLSGDETFLAGVGAGITTYVDIGDPASDIILSPNSNTTAGINSKFIAKYNDRLIAVDANDPTKLIVSGRYPNQAKFSWADGGGYTYIDPDSGEDITGIQVQPNSDKIVVYKNYSQYQVNLSTINIGNYVILDLTYQSISTSVGACNQDVIQTVENDTFFFGRKGIYVTGYEPNFLGIIRTNEISARIRPYLDLLNDTDYLTANALYVNNKYLLSFPARKELVVYDRERGSFSGIWKMPFGISKMLNYVDSTGTERWVIGSYDSNQVYTFETSLNSDDGTLITKVVRTGKSDFGSWSNIKILKYFYVMLRAITGSATVNIIIEDRDGTTTTTKSFTVTGSAVSGQSGWGANLWGSIGWGNTVGAPVVAGDELLRYGTLFKQARLVQVEVITNTASSNFELLNIRLTGTKQGEASLSSSSRV